VTVGLWQDLGRYVSLLRWFGVDWPWTGRSAIFRHVHRHLDPSGVGLVPGGERLPDEERFGGSTTLGFAPGAFDGIWGGGSADDGVVDRLYETLQRAVTAGFGPSWADLYAMLTENPALDYADAVIERIVERRDIPASGLYALARFLAERAPDREPVKFGVALLGIFRHPGDRSLFLTLGRHDEFTLYCAVALARTQRDPDEALWQLARSVVGWGRVQVVERLSKTEDDRIRSWMLREGFRNSVMNQYLACTCARTGRLLDALSEDDDEIDDGLVAAACELLSALVAGGPADDMDDYDDGAAATERLLTLLTARASTLQHFCTVAQLKVFLTAAENARPRPRPEAGWTAERVAAMVERCNEILLRSWWHDHIVGALEHAEGEEFEQAAQAARVLRIPTFRFHWERLQAESDSSFRWFHAATAVVTEGELRHLVGFAETRLPLEDIASGAAEELGLGAAYRWHMCLDMVLQRLASHPGVGWELVATALRSPVVRNRVQAVRVLSAWRPGHFKDYVRRAVEAAAHDEPDGDLREHFEKLLRNEAVC